MVFSITDTLFTSSRKKERKKEITKDQFIYPKCSEMMIEFF
jgi:hypothetical protein